MNEHLRNKNASERMRTVRPRVHVGLWPAKQGPLDPEWWDHKLTARAQFSKGEGGGARWSRRQWLERAQCRHSRIESSQAESGRDNACRCTMLGLRDERAERDEQPAQTVSAQSAARGEIDPNVQGADVVTSDRGEPIWGGMIHVGAWMCGPVQRGTGSPQR